MFCYGNICFWHKKSLQLVLEAKGFRVQKAVPD